MQEAEQRLFNTALRLLMGAQSLSLISTQPYTFFFPNKETKQNCRASGMREVS